MTSELFIDGWIIAAIMRSAIILLVTWFVVTVFRRSSAAALYRIWFLGLISCLILLPIGALLPQWKLGVLPPATVEQAARTSLEVASHEPMPLKSYTDAGADSYPQAMTSITPTISAIQDPVESNVASQPPSVTIAPNAGTIPESMPISTASLWVIAWFVGVAGAVARYLWHTLAARSLLLRSTPCTGSNWRHLADECAIDLQTQRPARIAFHPSSISPMVIGILRPAILLPQSANVWNTERRRLVLMHELSHIRRNDLLTGLVAYFVCALYWFNPLVWVAYRQLRKLREIACDDIVVTHSAKPALYAEALLDVAQSQRQRSLAGAIAMARTNNVKDRIACILDSARHRRPLTRRSALIVSLVAIVISIAVGTGGLTSRAQESKSQESTTQEPTAYQPPAQAPPTEPQEPTVQVDEAIDQFDEAVTQAIEEQTSQTPAKTPKRPARQKMVVKVLDENDNLMADVLVQVDILDFHDKVISRYEKPNLKTNGQGEATASFPAPVSGEESALLAIQAFSREPFGQHQQMDKLRISVSKVGYVPMYVSFHTGFFFGRDETLPTSYTFRLQKGQKLSGRIVDQNGNPVVGAKVQLKVDFPNEDIGSNPKPSFSPMTSERTAATTNKAGVWEISNAPSAQSFHGEFRLKVDHPWYAGDKDWGEQQTAQGVTTAQLRDGTAVIKLSKGLRITGLVTDAQGNQITKGVLVYSKAPHKPADVQPIELDSAGRYETEVLKPGTFVVTVSSPGHSPQQRQIELAEDMQEVNFSLQPGHTIKFRIVDESGKRIEKASAAVRTWRDHYCLYRADRMPMRIDTGDGGTATIYGNKPVSRSSILIHQNKEGICVWDSAPEDAVQYDFSALGYEDKVANLVAGPDVHEIRLKAKPTIFGTVTDKSTGKPIQNFTVSQTKEWLGAGHSPSSVFSDSVQNELGQYRIVFDGNWIMDFQYRVRIEATGYIPAEGTKTVRMGGDLVQEDFALQPATSLTAEVLDINGKPLEKFEMGVLTQSDHNYTSGGATPADIPLRSEPVLLRFSAEDGFAETLLQPGQQRLNAKLQPWASLTGRLMQGDRPIANEMVRYNPLSRDDGFKASLEDYQARTDEQGYFRFKKLPPGEGGVDAKQAIFSSSQIVSSEHAPIRLEAGKTTEVVLSGTGATLSGAIATPGRHKDSTTEEWPLIYLVRRDGPKDTTIDAQAVYGFDPSAPMDLSWIARTTHMQFFSNQEYGPSGFLRWLEKRPHHFLKMNKDGTIKVHGVLPGKYDLLIQLLDRDPDSLPACVGQKIVPITISAEQVATGNIDIGAIEVPCTEGPHVGTDMRWIEFKDSTGTTISIGDLQGRYVLLHIWASWNEQSMQGLPAMVLSAEKHAAKPITFLSFNVDSDKAKAEEVVRSLKMNWTQNYVGEKPELMRRLSIVSVPAFYLIGPDGKLVTSTESWLGVKDKLKTYFNPEEIQQF